MKMDFTQSAPTPETLDEAQQIIDALWNAYGELLQRFDKQEHRIAEQQKEIAALKEKLKINSKNSSKPPSSDIYKTRSTKVKSGKKRGGQHGHHGTFRALVPENQVDEVIKCLPEQECVCGNTVKITKRKRHQVYEIPQPRYKIIEYQIFSGKCVDCDKIYKGALPKGTSYKGFGAKTHSLLAVLTSKYRLSKRLAKQLLLDIYGMPISLGSVSNVEGTVSQALSATHREIDEYLKQEAIVHIDESGCKQMNKNGWVWVLSGALATLFVLRRSRGGKVARELIGNWQKRTIISDRYSSYSYLPDNNRQVCWAHLKRDFRRIAEREGVAGKLGRCLLRVYRDIFKLYQEKSHVYRKSHKKTHKKMQRLMRKLEFLLLSGTKCGHERTQQTSAKLLEIKAALWKFLHDPRISATNNQAERQLRPLVIWRKLSFGVQSLRGANFVERIFTVISSCIQQQKKILLFLQQALINYFSSENPPLLLLNTGT